MGACSHFSQKLREMGHPADDNQCQRQRTGVSDSHKSKGAHEARP